MGCKVNQGKFLSVPLFEARLSAEILISTAHGSLGIERIGKSLHPVLRSRRTGIPRNFLGRMNHHW